jgi:hypothetical protein
MGTWVHIYVPSVQKLYDESRMHGGVHQFFTCTVFETHQIAPLACDAEARPIKELSRTSEAAESLHMNLQHSNRSLKLIKCFI